jgi:hypothetical protein
MKKLLVTLACLTLVSSFAFAGADPDMDSFGFFFDTDGTIVEMHTAAPFAAATGYLVVSNPTSRGVSGWECKVDVLGPAVAKSWSYAGGGLNVYDAVATGLFNVGVGPGPGALVPINDVCVLATFSCYVMSPVDVITFTILPFPGSVTFSNTPGYVDADDVGIIYPCGVSSGFPYGEMSAIINGTGVVANEDMTWGGVKALFE